MRILCVIPVRGGSKGIPGKNARPVAGKPLLAWTVEQAMAELAEPAAEFPEVALFRDSIQASSRGITR